MRRSPRTSRLPTEPPSSRPSTRCSPASSRSAPDEGSEPRPERIRQSTPAATDGSAIIRGLDDPAFRYDRILVAIDDSRESRLALSRAVDIARRANARLDLLLSSVVPSSTYWGGAGQSLESNELYYGRVLRDAAASVEDVPVTSYLVRGNAAARLLEHAEKHGCDLIVMGSRGRNRAVAALLAAPRTPSSRQRTSPC